MNQTFSEINGKALNVEAFGVECFSGVLNAKMRCSAENGKFYRIIFRNVSKMKLSEVSFPFRIDGFEITDHSSRGYQKDSRYFVHDYEDGVLSFYCEAFECFASPEEHDGSKEVEIGGCIEIPMNTDSHDVADSFIEFVEKNGWTFGGGFRTIIDGWYVNDKRERMKPVVME